MATPEDCPLIDGEGNYTGPERRQNLGHVGRNPEDWHLDKTVSLAQIGTLLATVVLGTMFLMDFDKEITVNAHKIVNNAEQIKSEQEARRQADILTAERFNRHETDQQRTEDRIFAHLDKIQELLRQLTKHNSEYGG